MKAKKKQAIYWLCEKPKDLHFERAKSLEKKGFQVRFFNTLSSLISAVKSKRASFVVIGDEGEKRLVKKASSKWHPCPTFKVREWSTQFHRSIKI